MPTFRTIISLPAGITCMPVWRFLVWTFAGSLIWNSILAGAGLYLGSRFTELDRYVGPLAVVTMVAIVIAYIWRVATWKPRQR
jgi:membrane protein DedA with SNARE-associated domain